MKPTGQMLREESRARFNACKKRRSKVKPANDHMNRERFTAKMERNNRYHELRARGRRGVSRYSEQENGVAIYYVAWRQ